MKGIAACETYVILDGAISVSPVSYYTTTHKNEKGKKIKERHVYFEVLWKHGNIVRFERDRGRLPLNKHKDINELNKVIVYTDETMQDTWLKVCKIVYN